MGIVTLNLLDLIIQKANPSPLLYKWELSCKHSGVCNHSCQLSIIIIQMALKVHSNFVEFKIDSTLFNTLNVGRSKALVQINQKN